MLTLSGQGKATGEIALYRRNNFVLAGGEKGVYTATRV